jgi:hypothetical protein
MLWEGGLMFPICFPNAISGKQVGDRIDFAAKYLISMVGAVGLEPTTR